MTEIKLIECPRDAWQGLPEIIPDSSEGEYLKQLIAAGFRHIDAVSFVSPKHVKQMADSEEVMTALAQFPSGWHRASGNYRNCGEREGIWSAPWPRPAFLRWVIPTPFPRIFGGRMPT